MLHEGAPQVAATNLEEITNSMLTDEEKFAVKNGAKAEVVLEVVPFDVDEVPAVDRDALEKAAADLGATAGTWMDISLWKLVVGFERFAIHETSAPVKFSVVVPDELRNSNTSTIRTFYLIRVHGGEAKVVATGAGATLEAESDCFSTCLLAYREEERTEEIAETSDTPTGESSVDATESPVTTTQTTSTKPSTSVTSGTTSMTAAKTTSATPRTADSAPDIPVAVLTILGFASVAASVLVTKRI